MNAREFEQQVLTRSHSVPVVVDFWAAWCAPCRALGPTLEREVDASQGRVELVKVDVEDSRELAAQFEISGIPAVFAFRNGNKVADFVGARDAHFIRQWLATLAPSPSVLRVEQASTEPELRALLDDPEVGALARLKLAPLLTAVEGLSVLAAIAPQSPEYERAEQLKQRFNFMLEADSFGGLERARQVLERTPSNLEAGYALACAYAGAGQFELALEAFLRVVTLSRAFRDDAARKGMLAVIRQLKPGDELARTYQRRLQVVL